VIAGFPTGTGGNYLRLEREWKDGDAISVQLPMELRLRRWERNKGSISVDHGPLTYSLKIEEDYVRFDSKEIAQHDSKWQPTADPSKWPSFEIHAASAWNYGLSGDLADLKKSFVVSRKPWPKDNFPFTVAAVPVEIKTTGRKIPSWTMDQYGLCAEVPVSPVTTSEPEQTITLIPMGAARLRITAFPIAKK
jgi:hypothetical protein